MTTTTSEIDRAIYKAAEQDMRLARKHGEMAIADTKAGTVFLAYSKQLRQYRITAQPTPAYPNGIAVRCVAAGCSVRLQGLYQVEVSE
jgi:hypothetical protein